MIALVPTLGEAEQLFDLVVGLLDEGASTVLLTVNEDDPLHRLRHLSSHNVHVVPVAGSIYEGWNFGIRFARNIGDRHCLALLNDDLQLDPGALPAAERMLRDDSRLAVLGLDYRPDAPPAPAGARAVHGTYRHGGVHGCALLVDPRKVREVDPRFEWWYGDDDLVFAALEDGHGVALAEGCRVWHQGEATASKRPWTDAAKVRDRERFVEKWGDR